MTSISSMSIGFVWGWLFLLYKFPVLRWRRFWGLLAFALATALLAFQLYLYFNLVAVIIFFLAMAFSFILHVSWRKSIRDKNKTLRNSPIA